MFPIYREFPVTEESAVPSITGKEKAASVNKSSEDSTATGYRVLMVTEKSAVPTLVDKKPASNPVLTAGSPVTEVSRLQRIAGDKLGEQEVSSEKLKEPDVTWNTRLLDRQIYQGINSWYRPVLSKFTGYRTFSGGGGDGLWLEEKHQPAGLPVTDIVGCRGILNPPLRAGRRQLHMSLSLLRSSLIHPVLPTPVSFCITVDPPGTSYRALLHL